MRRLLPLEVFLPWFDRFLPRLIARKPATLPRPATVTGDYMGEHWLASFAVLALDDED